ncbi:MAG: tRNA (uridine(34)/cytosine(34)/5-carboxymethylaminomethyluridine(34)-2'-O)-methyltransferase TrmL [Methylococcus sp.]|jgi:tRNA (cytidine/uridine-2'-O-)-methyltransferase|nr:MAG: tRNA (uridine(34)/cytosine(34)/5-carboxymethylaminomethyluridine(34)-2'-O)-methyltransferase TrmL [Methylococcus sp.]
MFQVVLYEPEIAPNTGNIIRLCANAGASLHLIRPLGFEFDDKRLRRAGLDYHEFAKVELHDDFETYLHREQPSRLFALSTRGEEPYSEARFRPEDAFLFGPETRGLPKALRQALPSNQQLIIPMQPGSRSLNLSNAVALVLYEAWRQQGFLGRA